MTLGEKVKLKREELNLSQEELAEKMNYKSKTSIHKIEVGITDLPLSKVKELAAVLNTTPAYLMGWEDNKDKMINEIFHTEMIDSPELIEEISQLPFLDLWNKESSMLSTNMESFLKNDLNRLRNLVDLKNLKDSSSLKDLKALKASLQHLKAAKDFAYFIKSVENEKIIYFLIDPNKTSAKQLEKYVIEYKEKKYLKFLTKFKNEYIIMGINKNNEAESISKKDFKVLGTVIFEDSKE